MLKILSVAAIRRPAGYWNSLDNQRLFLESVGKELGVKKLSDWYQITANQLKVQGGAALFNT